jgi:hypothetical protein
LLIVGEVVGRTANGVAEAAAAFIEARDAGMGLSVGGLRQESEPWS